MEIESVLIKARNKLKTSERTRLRTMPLVIYLLACLTTLEYSFKQLLKKKRLLYLPFASGGQTVVSINIWNLAAAVTILLGRMLMALFSTSSKKISAFMKTVNYT